MSERLEHRPRDFVRVVDSHLILIGVAKREDFDKIAVPGIDHGADDSGHVLTKMVESGGSGVQVVFQYWLLPRTDAAVITGMQRDKKQKT
jgi:hypothetical protein